MAKCLFLTFSSDKMNFKFVKITPCRILIKIAKAIKQGFRTFFCLNFNILALPYVPFPPQITT